MITCEMGILILRIKTIIQSKTLQVSDTFLHVVTHLILIIVL